MTFIDQPTETALAAWRFGPTQAERLVASLLHSEGYSAVDPQAPLGGPDGLKDVLFDFSGWRYVAACYFPTTEKTFSDVRTKFTNDLGGVGRNGAEGIAFFTNQRLTIGERQELELLAQGASAKPVLYHIEAIRAILDSPRGYGMRLEYLRIPMKPEEQLSFVAQFGLGIETAMRRHSDMLAEVLSR